MWEGRKDDVISCQRAGMMGCHVSKPALASSTVAKLRHKQCMQAEVAAGNTCPLAAVLCMLAFQLLLVRCAQKSLLIRSESAMPDYIASLSIHILWHS